MKFLHLADIHLDTPFEGRSLTLRRRLREATREAFTRGLAYAQAAKVDAVMVAGDLFDGSTFTLQTEYFLIEQITHLTEQGIAFFYATGNHDPGTPGSPALQFPWPPGAHVFARDQAKTCDVFRDGRLVGTVTGIGHATHREARDLSVFLTPPPARQVPAVALLHTQVVGAGRADDHDRYAPSTLENLRSAGFDYWALGHIHLPQALEEQPGIHYPGNPQGRSPRETGTRGGLLVELEGPNVPPRIERVPLGRIRWEVLQLADLDEVKDVHALIQHIERAWLAARRSDPGLPDTEWIVRIELAGASPVAQRLREPENKDDLESTVSDVLNLLDVEVRAGALFPPMPTDLFRGRQDAVGEIFRLLDTLTENEAASQNLSQRLGLTAADLKGLPHDNPEHLEAYVAELLNHADRLLAQRFIRRGGGDT